jgi:hypothetical protein
LLPLRDHPWIDRIGAIEYICFLGYRSAVLPPGPAPKTITS